MTEQISTQETTTPMTSESVSVLAVILIALIFSIGSSYITWRFVQAYPPKGQDRIVTVDMARLAVSSAFAAAKSSQSPEVAAKHFLAESDKITDAYTKAGVLVINSQAVLNHPGTTDVTERYAKTLGIDLSKQPN